MDLSVSTVRCCAGWVVDVPSTKAVSGHGLRSSRGNCFYSALKAVQNDPDLFIGGILFAGRTEDVLDDLLAVALLGSGVLSHLHSLAVTMCQKPSLIKST